MAGNLTEQQPAFIVGQYNVDAVGGVGPQAPTFPFLSVAVARHGDVRRGSMLDRMIQAFFTVNTTQLALCAANAGSWRRHGGDRLDRHPDGADSIRRFRSTSPARSSMSPSHRPTGGRLAAKSGGGNQCHTQLPSRQQLTVLRPHCRSDLQLGRFDRQRHHHHAELSRREGGEVLPAGFTLTITAMAGGAGEPTFTSAISAIQAQEFDYVALPYTDSGTMAWATEYGFGSGGRWNYTRQQYGFVVGAYRDDYSDAITWGMEQNAPVMSTMVIEQQTPSPVWEWLLPIAALPRSASPPILLGRCRRWRCSAFCLRRCRTASAGQLNNLTNSGFAIQGVRRMEIQ